MTRFCTWQICLHYNCHKYACTTREEAAWCRVYCSAHARGVRMPQQRSASDGGTAALHHTMSTAAGRRPISSYATASPAAATRRHRRRQIVARDSGVKRRVISRRPPVDESYCDSGHCCVGPNGTPSVRTPIEPDVYTD